MRGRDVPDLVQQWAQQFASLNVVTSYFAIFCANYLVYVMGAAWLLIAVMHYRAISLALIVRVVLLVVLSYLLAKVLNTVISDPRPFIVAHQQPIVAISHDNGFPSDHTLLAMALTTGMWWLWRRFAPYFAVGTLLVMLGRLGIGAHHTLDVVGSVVIVLVVALVVGMIPLPRAWAAPIIGGTGAQQTR